MIYHLLDIFFLLFHTSLIIFNVFGWIWRKTRILNLITLLLTGASWVILGLIVGTIGYCPLTDWHFSVLEKLGNTNLPFSYNEYLWERLTGTTINPVLVDRITFWVFVSALAVSVILNIRDIRRSGGLGSRMGRTRPGAPGTGKLFNKTWKYEGSSRFS